MPLRNAADSWQLGYTAIHRGKTCVCMYRPCVLQVMMADHQALLQDYRALEGRVKPWADTFTRVSNRQPTWHDAEEHGGPEFGAAFKV
jgi:hypothetical protein